MRSGAPAVHGNSYENTFSAVISSPYLHLLAGLDRRKRIFIRYGEPQAHGNSVVKQDVLPLQGHCLNRSRAALGTESSCRLDQYGEPAYMSGFKAKSLLRVLWKKSVTVFCEKGLR